jgi:hypothetical protein
VNVASGLFRTLKAHPDFGAIRNLTRRRRVCKFETSACRHDSPKWRLETFTEDAAANTRALDGQ